MQDKVPVLFIIFNRLDTTKKVFNAIRHYQPDKLYIASDGARNSIPEETERIQEIRNYIIDNIDWDCEVNTLFRDNNVGCGRGPSEAITWLFENEEMGIILEDDCVPSTPFFEYCELLLKKYQYDNRVWIISGRSHYQKNKFFDNQDYLFSNYVVTWGWATWKRCWNKFDINIRNYWPEFYNKGGFKNVFFTKIEGVFRNLYYLRMLKDKEFESHVWDYQFLLNMHQNRGLGVVPSKNLIENIGYEGTHFVGAVKMQKFKAVDDYSLKKDPGSVLLNRKYETSYFYNEFGLRMSAFIKRKLLEFRDILKKS